MNGEESMDTTDSSEQLAKTHPSESNGNIEEGTYIPGQKMSDGVELEHDPSAYIMLHEAKSGAPCLSFDIIPDDLGQNRDNYPQTIYMVAGTQADRRNRNKIIVTKMSNLRKTQRIRNESDEESSSSEDEDEIKAKTPVMNVSSISHYGCVNRIRSKTYENKVLVAAWSELGRVTIWDLNSHLRKLENPSTLICAVKPLKKYKRPEGEKEKPLFTFSGHLQEGYGMDWSSTMSGVLATGDCSSNIYVWKPRENEWIVDLRPFKSHTHSVEDLQWSPSEANVLASCSVDKSLKIWDIRAAPHKACMLTLENAHDCDVNVISWNKTEPLLVSGGDDGYLRVWDLRNFKKDAAVATFKHHTEPVTTLEWNPNDSSVFASGSEDNQVVLWDLAMERDAPKAEEEDLEDVPPQLMFIHMGQEFVKEIHWHPQIPGCLVSTAETGFNIFKTINS